MESARKRGWAKTWVCFTFTLILFSLALSTSAQVTYTPLVGLPQLAGSGGGRGLASYFNQLYIVAIAVGAILAFIKISIAGVKYSMSGVITDKASAKHDIQGALLGLVILLIPFIVLNTIYDGLTSLNILNRAPRVDTTAAPLSTQQAQQQAVTNLQLACDVRNGSLPPPGCPGSLTEMQSEIARLCAQSGGVYSASSGQCIRNNNGASTLYPSHQAYTTTEQLRWRNVCGGRDAEVSAGPTSGSLLVSCPQPITQPVEPRPVQ